MKGITHIQTRTIARIVLQHGYMNVRTMSPEEWKRAFDLNGVETPNYDDAMHIVNSWHKQMLHLCAQPLTNKTKENN